MEHVLNLNTVKRPTFMLTLTDDENTTLRVMMPTVALFKEMQTAAEMVDAVEAGAGDEAGISVLYDVLARLLSCNRDYKAVTAEELRGKYNMELEDVLLVYREYMKFISGVIKEKN